MPNWTLGARRRASRAESARRLPPYLFTMGRARRFAVVVIVFGLLACAGCGGSDDGDGGGGGGGTTTTETDGGYDY